MKWSAALALALPLTLAASPDDWPMLHGNAQHDGFRPTPLTNAWHLAWVREFPHERLGSALEPIVNAQGVYITTHQGSVHALHPQSGTLRWTYNAAAPFLHSPALQSNLLVAADADGTLYGLSADSGRLHWRRPTGRAGYSASPVLSQTTGYIGDRAGLFTAFHLQDGRPAWSTNFAVPIRQTAALDANRVYVTTEDLRVRCLDAQTGAGLWTSAPLAGQTARDGYPVVCSVDDRTYVIVRTNPLLNMARRIAADRTALASHAGADDRDWRRLDQWIKSPAARGTPALWDTEQTRVRTLLQEDPEARTFFVLDATTGAEAFTAPILWVGGCQGLGILPARTVAHQLLVLHRTAYGNWNLGVAPLVGLGLLDLPSAHITPLFHNSGPQPTWNTFWGTADEAQNLVVADTTALITHQGTLSGFNLLTRELFPIAGNRDTFGGFPSPSWARNEWHGPARGGVAITADGLFWVTGSRILALQPGPSKALPPIRSDPQRSPNTFHTPSPPVPDWTAAHQALNRAVRQVLSQTWAPLTLEPGLAGRQFFFDHSGETFEALAWAYPRLPAELRKAVKEYLAATWDLHRPFTEATWYPLDQGAPREWANVPQTLRVRRPGSPPRFHPFGNLHSAWFYAQRCHEQDRVLSAWPEIRQCYEDFSLLGWRLDPERGDRWANRYAASWLALAEIALRCNEAEISRRAESQATEVLQALVRWWQRAAAELEQPVAIRTVADLDPFIGQGGAFSLRLAPHNHKVGIFQDLTPEVAGRLLDQPGLPDLTAGVDRWFHRLQPTWWLVGEERQIHYGENYLDPPDHAYHAFRSLVFLSRMSSPARQLTRTDAPFCRADLYHLAKLAIALESQATDSAAYAPTRSNLAAQLSQVPSIPHSHIHHTADQTPDEKTEIGQE